MISKTTEQDADMEDPGIRPALVYCTQSTSTCVLLNKLTYLHTTLVGSMAGW